MFSYLGPDIEDAQVLDLFSGSGSLGLEALSRGASGVTFVEGEKAQVRIIEQNVATCGFQNKTRVILGDVFRTIRNLYESGYQYDFILADPPFRAAFHAKILETVSRYPVLTRQGELLIEHEQHDQAVPTDELERIRVRRFGHCQISIYGVHIDS